MQGPLERMDNSPGLLAAVCITVLIIVALGVFAVGSLFGGDDGSTSADGAQAIDDSADNQPAGSDDQSSDSEVTDENDQENENSDNNENDDDSDSDESDSDEEDGNEKGTDEDGGTDLDGAIGSAEDDSEDDATTESGGDSDFCEALTRNNFTFQFASGATSADQSHTVNAGEVDLHQLEVNQGQILTASLEADTPAPDVEIMAPDGTSIVLPVVGTTFTETIAPTEAGYYQICVDPQGETVTYTLTVSVINDNSPAKISAPWCGDSVNDRGEIRFAAGAISGTVEQSVIGGERDLYRFEAGEGQALDLNLNSLEDNAAFSLQSPSGEIIVDSVSDFLSTLPESGDYLICVGGTRGNATYTLTTTIE